ncbi:unnamed protein product, partial [Meganyctiphanes norvegica]
PVARGLREARSPVPREVLGPASPTSPTSPGRTAPDSLSVPDTRDLPVARGPREPRPRRGSPVPREVLGPASPSGNISGDPALSKIFLNNFFRAARTSPGSDPRLLPTLGVSSASPSDG